MSQSESNQWDKIFQRDGYQFFEPRPQVARFVDLLKERGLNSVLDLGCGRGRHVVHMARQGLRVGGMDNSPTALKLTAQWLGKEGISANLILADMREALPFESDSFDAVLSTQVIHHALLATVIQTANEIQRVLRKGGVMLVSVPVRKVIEEGGHHNEIEPNTFLPLEGPEQGLPHHLFMPEELRDIFPQCKTLDLQVFDDSIIALQAIKI